MNRLLTLSIAIIGLLLSAASCGKTNNKQSNSNNETEMKQSLPPSPFSADNAYEHIAKQVSFGPRVPNSEGHKATAEYIIHQMEQLGLQVTRQMMKLTAYDGTELNAINIIASYHPEREKRVMIFAHWDTRPFADHDSNIMRQRQPILGADDGASGPAVMIELARVISEKGIDNYGIDFIFFDAEDYGLPVWETNYDGNREETWALGTQYWTKNLHQEDYRADFGILLDMVGAKDATFLREYFSQESAGKLVTRIWQTASQLGHSKYFINKMGGAITDDHYFVINNLRIPCVDIINYSDDFGSHWHTHDDNMDIISKETLQAVGETVWQVLVDYDNDQFGI